MEVFIVLAVSFALCVGEEIPKIPGDNSHYVEGESRYIWIPDGEGKPHLADLKPPIASEKSFQTKLIPKLFQSKYLLYTRKNPSAPQKLVFGDTNSIQNSNYNGNRSTKVIVHGWHSNGNADWMARMATSFLDVEDANVISVDWSDLASLMYTTSALSIRSVGNNLAMFMEYLFTTAGGDWADVHLAGHSLGAHVVGIAGRAASSKPARVTGMDPAGPLFFGGPDTLSPQSGTFVEAIHTNAGALGITNPVGHVDFYVNGGSQQPGCSSSICSHLRSHELFSSAIRTNHLRGRKCSNLQAARRNACTGDSLDLGNTDLFKQGKGIYALSTRSEWPY